MAQFDVYENLNSATCDSIPYLLDVQADLLDALATRVVVPLVLASEAGGTAKHFCPQFKIKGTAVVMSTGELAGLPLRTFGVKVTTLKNKRDEIIAALDLLLTGI
ncbi:MAG: CcdB family protein [Gallionellaceae bacterium]